MNDQFARAMAALTNGIYVLTVANGARHHGMSSSWVTQVSGEPPLIMAAVDRNHSTGGIIARSGAFGLNVVGVRGRALEDYFYSAQARRPDNLEGIDYTLSPHLGVPWLALAAVSLEARVVQSLEAGDHALYIAELAGVRFGAGERPLTSLDLGYVYVGGKQVIARDRTGWE
ncbi:MAG TPA: flavin reductase family protein [Candidatus Binataceae bacterium]|nr:flavin reductase family protein [Candidatus Binataceae bacterium]